MIPRIKTFLHNKGLLANGDASLSKDVTRSGVWVFALQIVTRGLSFVKTIVLARILAPSDFGLFGIALVTLSFLDDFSEVGIDEATIQKKDPDLGYLNTAWVMKIIRGLLIGGILFIGAPYIAAFFKEPAAANMLRVMALVPVIAGFINIGVIYFQKDLAFHKYFLYQFLINFSNFAITVIFALWLQNVWALVFGMIAGAIVSVVLSFVFHTFRPKFQLVWEYVKDIFNYGKWLFATSVFTWFSLEGDDVFVGRMLGTTSLGYYQLSFKIGGFASTEIRNVVTRITLPAYAKIQEFPKRVKNAYTKVLVATSFLALPVSTFTILFAEPFTLLVLGDKWAPIIPVLRILAVAGAIRAVSGTAGSLFKGIGLPKVSFMIQIPRFIAMFSVIYPMILRYGIMGAAYAEVIGLLVYVVVWLFALNRYIQLSLLEVGRKLMRVLLANGLIILLFLIFVPLVGSWNFFNFTISTIALTVVYLLAIGPQTIKGYLGRISSK